MNRYKILVGILFISCFILVSETGFAQITSDADAVVPTEYSSGSQDKIHVFCGAKGDQNASLTATAPNGETGSFEWLKYNSLTGIFDFFSSDLSGNTTSTISNLADGCYRVHITSTSGVKTYTAWGFNNYIEAKAEITESDCTSFTLKGTIDPLATLTYVDLPTGQSKVLAKDIQVKWLDGNVVVSRVIVSKVYDPPTKDTGYTLDVTDRFGCMVTAEATYISIVTKALFSVSVDKGEAPLEVTFNNESENGDPGKYEWFIFKDIDEIKREALKNPGSVIDSILEKMTNDSPVYTFENSGKYQVKLVSQKKSEFHTCYDIVYFKYIVADTSFVDAPNVFTPNGDGVNDEFIVKFWSMKEIKISIFNRWGKLLHVWESNNVLGFGPTIESVPQSVWDGKVGGKYATPGVYYYVVEGRGRDNLRKRTSGFFHLFRDK
ncbi:MAG: gliding motility-associated C-terminal domain-containing protein [Bacteroidota bacterium]|nr:gliding motility-associated C-terminal domain-containing protein [Bacteroidota bacterium]